MEGSEGFAQKEISSPRALRSSSGPIRVITHDGRYRLSFGRYGAARF